MNKIKVQHYFIPLLFILLYSIAWKIQDNFLFKGDVSWQIHLAKILLSGGSYVKDFFEINPPLSIYLYMPTIFFQKIFSLSNIIALRLYIFIIATVSLLVCHLELKKMTEEKANSIHLIMMTTLFFVYLILPLSEFGQRECFLLYFTMPYFLLVGLRLNAKKVAFLPAISIGVFAGLGFAIKPFFILSLCFVELYYLSQQRPFRKNVLSFVRPETVSIFFVFVLYLILIAIFHPEYIKTVIPIASHFYYQSFAVPLSFVILCPLVIYVMSTPLLYPLFSISTTYKQVATVLLLALTGFFIAYVMQQLPWYYHLFPAFGVALILYTLSFSLFLRKYRFNKPEFIFVLLIASIAFFYPCYYIKAFYKKNILIKHAVEPLIKDLQTQKKHQSVYFFSSNAAYMVSVFEHAHASHASRLQFLSWMQTYHHPERQLPDSMQLKNNERFFMNMLVEDIKNNKPVLIYVDQSHFYTNDEKEVYIDYIKLLSRYPQFKDLWKKYHYLKTIENPTMYKFDIYRIDPA